MHAPVLTVAGTVALLAASALAETEQRSETAFALSAGGSVGILIVAAHSAASADGGAVFTTGLFVRAAGAALVLAGADLAFDCDELDADCRRDSGQGLAVVGVGVFMAGVLWDVATAPRAARRWNTRHGLALAPTVTSGGAGLALGGAA